MSGGDAALISVPPAGNAVKDFSGITFARWPPHFRPPLPRDRCGLHRVRFAGERAGVRGPYRSVKPPHPDPLPHIGVLLESSAECGGRTFSRSHVSPERGRIGRRVRARVRSSDISFQAARSIASHRNHSRRDLPESTHGTVTCGRSSPRSLAPGSHQSPPNRVLLRSRPYGNHRRLPQRGHTACPDVRFHCRRLPCR